MNPLIGIVLRPERKMSGIGKTVAGILAAIALSLCAGCSGKMRSGPNIIVVLTDDQGFGQLPVYSDDYPDDMLFLTQNTARYHCDGQKAKAAAKASMPNLQRLANCGVTFLDAHVTAPVCGPSRSALMTGRYQQRMGIYDNCDLTQAGIPVSETFLPELLQKAGYQTGMIGKWHLGKYTREKMPVQTHDYHRNTRVGCVVEDHPLNRGFDLYFGFNGSGTTYFDSPSLFRGFKNVPARGFLTDEFTDEAVRFIQSAGQEPFFLYLAYNAPHIPLEAPAPKRYQRFNTGNPEVDNYYAYLAAVDDGLGKIIQTLENREQLDNTLIFYLSDNGAVVESPQPMNGPFRGNKGQFRQGGTRVPMIAHWPDGFAPARFAGRVASIDVLPTALAAAGVDIPSNVDGVDLRPHLERGTDPHNALFWAGPEIMHWNKRNEPFWAAYWNYVTERSDELPQSALKNGEAGWAVLKGPWLLRCNEVHGTVELYNVETDAGEQTDVSAQHADVVDSLRQDYKQWSSTLDRPLVWSMKEYERLTK